MFASPAPPSAVTAAGERTGQMRGPRAGVGALLLLLALVGASLAWLGRGVRKEGSPVLPALPSIPPPSIILRMHGSNTIGSDLGPALAEGFLAKQTGAKVVLRRRTATDEMLVEARDGDRVVEAIEIFAHGSSTAFEDLANRRCDVGMASRRIRDEETKKAAALGDMSSAASERVIALDGLALIVNPNNPVSVLSKTQIAGIFAGEIRRWSEVGGSDAPIVVHARDDKSGTFDTFKALVLEGRPLLAEGRRHESSDELSDAVAADPSAIGFIGLPYVRSAKAVMVQEAGSAPLLPSPMTVSTEDYPLARRLYLYVPLSASVTSRDFVDFAQSEEGQRIVQAAGFVDLRPTCDANAHRCSVCPPEYRSAVRGACRMSMNFRFERASTQLDTRALSDLQRVVSVMQRPEYAPRSLILLGFSDGTGARSENLMLSERRAEVVGAQLQARGLHVERVQGFGPDMPISDDSSDPGRQRNRRVELWLR
jgi:phosphate transport system substrate-binding protein